MIRVALIEDKAKALKYLEALLSGSRGISVTGAYSTGLRSCFSHLRVSEIFGHNTIMLLLIVHLLLGYRKLRNVEYYKDDPLVKRLLGLKKIPDVSTVSRALRSKELLFYLDALKKAA